MPNQKAIETAAPPLPDIDADGFRAVGKGFRLGLRDGKLLCRNAKGNLLAQVPKDLRESEVAEGLFALADFLQAHEAECRAAVEGWLLRSLPTPSAVLFAVWPDAAWRTLLENAVIVSVDAAGAADESAAGFLKAVDEKRGLGLVDASGETIWVKPAAFLLRHPSLLEDLDALRSLAAELGLSQGIMQLFREVFAKPLDLAAGAETIDTFKGGRFEQLSHARGAAKGLGYRVSGSWVSTRVHERGQTVEARLWLSGDYPDDEATIEGLGFCDEMGEPLALANVPPIAFSEGMRMASKLYGKRVIEKAGDDV